MPAGIDPASTPYAASVSASGRDSTAIAVRIISRRSAPSFSKSNADARSRSVKASSERRIARSNQRRHDA
jgi:hypothetical protein